MLASSSRWEKKRRGGKGRKGRGVSLYLQGGAFSIITLFLGFFLVRKEEKKKKPGHRQGTHFPGRHTYRGREKKGGKRGSVDRRKRKGEGVS